MSLTAHKNESRQWDIIQPGNFRGPTTTQGGVPKVLIWSVECLAVHVYLK